MSKGKPTMNKRTILFVGVCVCLLALPAWVEADTIFSNLGPFISSDSPGYNALQPACVVTALHPCAAEFTSPGDFLLTQIEAPPILRGFGAGALPVTFLTLRTDDNGKPGAALEQFQIGTRGLLGQFPAVPPETLNSILQPLLFAGQEYWLELSNTNTVFNSFAFWPANSTGDIGPVIGIGLPGGNATPIIFGTRPAFAVGGMPVPEPSSLLLLGSGMAGFVVFLRRRNRIL